ncbi:MAG TPA: metallophosphoesterase family protein [Dissulfurispiraceae bacterium]|nr:metallophosphoesterase family protein [Dissulfurispiraceae bacterium]
MKIAVFGDIHGNIHALRAAYAAALAQKPDTMYHVGDLGGYNPFVNEVIDFLIEKGIEGVQGNYDETVANDRAQCGCKYEDPAQAELAHHSFMWTKKRATEKSKGYMRNLPVRIDFVAEGRKVALFHATPHKNNLYWYEDRTATFFREMASKVDADVLIYGHTHVPYRKDIGGTVFINTGSVGRPKDGDPRTCVCMVDIQQDAVATEFLRVPYDVDAADVVIKSGLPVAFAAQLKTGKP